MNEILKPEEVALILKTSPSWVYANKHKIGFLAIGGNVRFEKNEVELYCERSKRGPSHQEQRQWVSASVLEKIKNCGLSQKSSKANDLLKALKEKAKAKNKPNLMQQNG